MDFKEHEYLAAGNPGAYNVLDKSILDVRNTTDEEAKQMTKILKKYDIIGQYIWVLYKDYCKESIKNFKKVLLDEDRIAIELLLLLKANKISLRQFLDSGTQKYGYDHRLPNSNYNSFNQASRKVNKIKMYFNYAIILLLLFILFDYVYSSNFIDSTILKLILSATAIIGLIKTEE